MPGLEGTELSWSGVRCLSKSGVYLSALVWGWGCVAFSCQAPRCFRLIKPDVQGPRLKSLRGSCSDSKVIAPKSNQVRDPNRFAKPIHLTCIALHDSPPTQLLQPPSARVRRPRARQRCPWHRTKKVISILQEAPKLLELLVWGLYISARV